MRLLNSETGKQRSATQLFAHDNDHLRCNSTVRSDFGQNSSIGKRGRSVKIDTGDYLKLSDLLRAFK